MENRIDFVFNNINTINKQSNKTSNTFKQDKFLINVHITIFLYV